LRKHSLDLLEKRFEGSELQQLTQVLNSVQEELAAASAAATAAKQRKSDLVKEAEILQHEIANFSQEKGKRIKTAKEKLATAKRHVEACKKSLKAAEAALQVAIAEGETAAKERIALAAQLEAVEAATSNLQAKVDELATVVAVTKTKYDETMARLEERRARLKECDAEISAAVKARNGLEKQRTDMVVERKRAGNRLEALRKGAADAVDRCRALERDYPWIDTEREHFGKTGSDYDWIAHDPTEVFKQWETARKTIDTLAKKVNKKVMQMFEKAEEEYTELKRKKDVVENDKQKIREVMDELDDKKREALQTTWRKVTADLGSIFSTLLPGTTAKLEPEEGKTFMDGLEVKVAFGGVWKDSLSELSGGQKSLLALSLILAMLLFKPAPIYILDEVDAALDLSHTQNIGRMIKTHFPQSQFIVVSLKEGMFNNANVIFRTKFVDGVSTVTRTINERAGEQGGKQAGRRPRAALKDANAS
jgi:structural maintenance of chromosome 2